MALFIAMNHFQVDPERGAEFEAHWRERETYLAEVPGFLRFALLRGDEPGSYVSHSTWQSRAAFEAWTRSELLKTAVGDTTPRGATRDPNVPRVNNGISGDARRSSKELGKKAYETKVEYAVRQIQTFIPPK